MKGNQLFILFTLLVFSTTLTAQVPDPDINAAEAAMTEGVNNCMIVSFVDIDKKETEKIWQNFSKKQLGQKSKKIKKANEYLTDGASISGISGKPKIFASFREGGNNTEMRIWVNTDNGYVNPDDYPSDYSSVRDMLISFNRAIEKSRVEEELKGEEKTMKNLEKDLKGLGKEKDKLEDKIKDYEKKIQEAKERIAENEREQEAKTAEIKIQSGVVDDVKSRLGNIGN